MDTALRLNFRALSPKDELPKVQGSFWNDIRLIETDEQGLETRVFDYNVATFEDNRNYPKLINHLIFGGGNSGGNNLWNTDVQFALRRFPHPKRRLELRVDSVWRPVTTQGIINSSTPGEVAQMRVQRDALSISQRFVLRKAGEAISTPRASTDPLFDVRGVGFSRARGRYSSQPSVRIQWDIHWRGPLKKDNVRMFAPISLRVEDERNNDLGQTTILGELNTDWKKGRDFSGSYDYELSSIRASAKEHKSKTLYLRGWISINNRWPREVNLKLPDWVLHN